MPQDSQVSPTTDLEMQLAHLLDDLSHVQEEMLDVLAEKRDRMAEGDLAGMSKLQPRVQAMCERLQACHGRREQLLMLAAEQGHKVESLGALVDRLPVGQAGEMASQVKETAARMRLVQLQSLTNWVLAQRSLLHVSQLLEIIATGGQMQPTYGRGPSPTSHGALVDREA